VGSSRRAITGSRVHILADFYRNMNLTIIKNRNGERGVVKFKFYAARSEFVETGKEELVEDVEQ
jgi:replicative DNA helicase